MDFEFDLDEALKKHPLPKGLSDVVMNRDQIARALGKSSNTIDKWVDKGLPVLEEGTNGKAYKFQASHCFAWRKAFDEFEADRKLEADKASEQMALQFLALDEDEQGLAGMSARELKEFNERETFYNQTAQGRINRVMRADVFNLFSKVFTIVQQGIEFLPDELERTAGLSPQQVAAAVKVCDNLIVGVRNRIEADPIYADVGASVESEKIPDHVLQ